MVRLLSKYNYNYLEELVLDTTVTAWGQTRNFNVTIITLVGK